MAPDVGGGPNPCPQGLAVCDDFEETPVGQPPRQSLWAVGAPDCSPQRGTATIDSTQAHSGRHSVKVVNDFSNGSPPSYCDHVFFNNTTAFNNGGPGQPIQGGQVYGRFFVYLQNPVAGMNHTTFATFTDKANGGEQLRIGFASDVFVWNRTAGGGALYLPELDTGNSMINTQPPNTMQPTSGSWFCVEFHIDETAGGIDTWIDGTEYPGLMVQNGMPVTDVSTLWLGGGSQPPQIASFGLGWETYVNAAADGQVLWFDDVALADHKIGCTF